MSQDELDLAPTPIPLAHEVENCPPHYWIVSETMEQCAKCQLERKVPSEQEMAQVIRERFLARAASRQIAA